MGKRKQGNGDNVKLNGKAPEDESSGDEDFDTLNVDFEFFDPQQIDFHGIKVLLQQLFDIDATLFDLSAVADLILSQPLLGSTVKVDGNETDAYAFLSVINLQQHADKPAISKIIQYLKARSNSTSALAQLSALLTQSTIPQVGLILTDRLINVPSELAPPMYTMLLEEIGWATEEKEPYSFSHYLVLSKTYTEIESKLDAEDDRPKKKKKSTGGVFETMFFHPEDEVFQRHALCSGGFDYSTQRDEGHSDSKRAFQEMGIKPQGHAILIEASRFRAAVQEIVEYLKP